MANFSVEGKLGTGKTKFCVWRSQICLRSGLRVASNIDLDLGHLVPELAGAFYSRIPDKPSAADLDMLGHGNPSTYDEDRNGILILDELGSWLNARNFQDKARAPVIDWLIHARKHGWHVYFIVQGASMIDAQVREHLIEYSCKCRRLDKVKVPIFGSLLSIFNPRWAYLPRLHQVVSTIGDGVNSMVAERWNFRGDDLHAAYDTRQIFSDRLPPDVLIDGCYTGFFSRSFSVLHPHYFNRPPPVPTFLQKFHAFFHPVERSLRPLLPKHPLVLLCEKLPAADRIRHIKRLSDKGFI